MVSVCRCLTHVDADVLQASSTVAADSCTPQQPSGRPGALIAAAAAVEAARQQQPTCCRVDSSTTAMRCDTLRERVSRRVGPVPVGVAVQLQGQKQRSAAAAAGMASSRRNYANLQLDE
jgi:hypothetical protein